MFTISQLDVLLLLLLYTYTLSIKIQHITAYFTCQQPLKKLSQSKHVVYEKKNLHVIM